MPPAPRAAVGHTYLGPTGEEMIAIARSISSTKSTDFAAWAAEHMASAAG